METTQEKTIAEIVVENYRAADVFKKHGIDFCCGGKISVKEMCRKKNLDYNTVQAHLDELDNVIIEDYDFNRWQLDDLVNYILDKHHRYIIDNAELIQQYADKVARVHGHHRTEVVRIDELFREAIDELDTHMMKEERVLFPYIIQLAEAQRQNTPLQRPPFGTAQNPIRMMEMEHETVGNIFHEISELSSGYNPPAEACNTYRVLYAKLQEFENDLHRHIHLENNILFPKAMDLEALL
jgi:regulator of cell morphogenesis and NO signaling